MYIYFLVIGGITIIGLIFAFINMKKQKNRIQDFLSENPTAGKVHLKSSYGVTQEVTTVYTVNNESPYLFTKGTKSGFYAPVGNNIISVSYSYTRPGVMYRSVTKSTDVIELEIEIEENKEYELSFDKKAETFVFEEKENKQKK